MSFKVLYIKEHDYGVTNKIDSEIFILYDPLESTYFYYGNRRMNKRGESILYNGHYECNRIDALNTFLYHTFGKYTEVITYEMHDIKIDESQFNTLNSYVLRMKLTSNTEIFAYDQTKVTKNDVLDLLDILVTHQV